MKQLLNTLRNYPTTCFYLLLLAGIIGYYSDLENFDEGLAPALAAQAAMFGSAVVAIFTRGRKIFWRILGEVINLGLAINFTYNLIVYPGSYKYIDPNMEYVFSYFSYLYLLIALLYFPLIRGSWSITIRGISGTLRACVLGVCVLIACAILYAVTIHLFNIEIKGIHAIVFITIAVGGMFGIASFNPRDGEARIVPFVLKTLTYGLIPVFALWTLILYLYAVKVLITGYLTVNDLFSMVASLFIAICLTRIILAREIERAENRIAVWFDRLVPWLMILPVGLTTWLLCDRVAEYGITVNRLYGVVVNVWMYGIIIWWLLTGAKRPQVMPLTLSGALFLVSGFFINIVSITRQDYRDTVIETLTEKGYTLPLDRNDYYFEIQNKLDDRTKSRISALRFEMGRGALEGILSESVPTETAVDDEVVIEEVVAENTFEDDSIQIQ
ncbi:MAG: hypothetical protein ACI30D_04710 [Muribaculaceae bacterium]